MSKQERLDRSAPELTPDVPPEPARKSTRKSTGQSTGKTKAAAHTPAGSASARSRTVQPSLRFESGDRASGGQAAPGAAAESGASTHWRQLLAGSSAREVLARIFQGDPLELRANAAEVLRRRAYVLDVGRVYLRSLAYVARFAGRYRGQPELGVWLRERIDEAILDLLEEDREAARDEDARAPDVYTELARPLGLDGGSMWRATIAFNACTPGERRAFYDWILEGGVLDELARAGGSSPTQWARRARAALDVVLRAQEAATRRGDDS